jgi:hypothetical protein
VGCDSDHRAAAETVVELGGPRNVLTDPPATLTAPASRCDVGHVVTLIVASPLSRTSAPRPSSLRDRKRAAALIAPQVQVIVRDQEHAEGVVVAIAAGESRENGPTSLRFLRSKTHVVPLGKACLAGGIRREYTPAACAAQDRPE